MVFPLIIVNLIIRDKTELFENQYNKDVKYIVKEDGLLMDFLLRQNLKRGDVKNYLKYKNTYVNGTPVSKFDYALKKGDTVEIIKGHVNTNTKLNIIYEDKEFIVINKPCGLLSERAYKEANKTAFNYVREYLEAKHEEAYIVHRIDQYTSGVLMFVKNSKLAKAMTERWNDLVKKREYIAICEGRVEPKEKRIETLLYENSAQIVKVSKTEGKKAITNYHVLKENSKYSMLQVDIETGRKNQIRVHLSYLGYPIIGDDKYGNKQSPIKRLGLHANRFEFRHPFTDKLCSFEAEVPECFNSLFKEGK